MGLPNFHCNIQGISEAGMNPPHNQILCPPCLSPCQVAVDNNNNPSAAAWRLRNRSGSGLVTLKMTQV